MPFRAEIQSFSAWIYGSSDEYRLYILNLRFSVAGANGLESSLPPQGNAISDYCYRVVYSAVNRIGSPRLFSAGTPAVRCNQNLRCPVSDRFSARHGKYHRIDNGHRNDGTSRWYQPCAIDKSIACLLPVWRKAVPGLHRPADALDLYRHNRGTLFRMAQYADSCQVRS